MADAPARVGVGRESIGCNRAGSVNQNLARAIGPALGGLLLAATSAAALFAVNAVSFVAVLAAVAVTAVPKRELPFRWSMPWMPPAPVDDSSRTPPTLLA